MKYYLSAPAPVEHVGSETLNAIVAMHGSYEAFNEKLAAGVNLPQMIEVFERVLNDSDKELLANYNITLYSGKHAAEVTTGVPLTYEPQDCAAITTVVHGVPYIAVDTDLLIENPKNATDEGLRTVLTYVLTHEIIHYDQVVRGDLEFTPSGIIWKGTFYSHELIAQGVAKAKTNPNPATALVEQQIQLPWELEAYGRSSFTLDLEQTYANNPELLELFRHIQKRYIEEFAMDARAVKLGNGFDTNGCDVTRCIVLKVTKPKEAFLTDKYYLLTPMGIAVACLEDEGYFYSTHCMPLSYAEWIKTNWGLEVDALTTQIIDLVPVVREGIKSCSEAEALAASIANA